MFKKLSRILLSIIVISIFFYFIKSEKELFYFSDIVSPYLSLGFLIIVAILFGMIAKIVGLPAITGYLLSGIFFGPQGLGFISKTDVSQLELINSIALTFIAITAGGELKMKSLRQHFNTIIKVIFVQTIFLFGGIFALFFFLIKNGYLLSSLSGYSVLFFSMFLGVIAVSKSPATTIAVINETKAKGEFTDIILGSTMIKDVVVLVIFSVVFVLAKNVIGGVPFSYKFILKIFAHIFISGFIGVGLGFIMILFFKYVARELSIFIVLISFLSYQFAQNFELEFMFMCIVAGFVVQNFSKQGHALIDAIENSHLPVYVIFFSIAGGGLDFSYLNIFGWAIVIFVLVRIALIFISTNLGARLSVAPDALKKYGWMGYITNAGLTLSLVVLVEKEFPAFGSVLKSLIISVIAIHLLIGPVLFRISLSKAGEITAKD